MSNYSAHLTFVAPSTISHIFPSLRPVFASFAHRTCLLALWLLTRYVQLLDGISLGPYLEADTRHYLSYSNILNISTTHHSIVIASVCICSEQCLSWDYRFFHQLNSDCKSPILRLKYSSLAFRHTASSSFHRKGHGMHCLFP